MKHTIKTLSSMLLILALLLALPVTALAADTFNAGVTIAREDNTITVTVAEDDNTFLAAQSPMLSIVCDFTVVTVTFGDEVVPSVLSNGMVSFPVKEGGTYVITAGSSEDEPDEGCQHPDADGDEICDNPDCGIHTGATLEGAIVGLKDSIHMNLYVSLSEEALSAQSVYLEITRGPDAEPELIPLGQASESNGYYCFTAQFSAKEMTDMITYRIIMDDTSSEVYDYSLRNYADIILSDSNNYSAADRTMVKAMLFYGSYAQRHFGYKTDALADKDLSMAEFDLDSVTAETLKTFANSAAQGTEKVTLLGSSLLLKSETVLRLFFKVDSSVANTVTFKIGNQALTPQTKDGYSYVDITGITAKKLNQDITVVINDGTEATVVYNPMSYCYTVLANASSHPATLVDMVKALYLYNQTAISYFNG